MSENIIQPVPPHYYDYESNRKHLEEENRRVEQIIEEERRRTQEIAEENTVEIHLSDEDVEEIVVEEKNFSVNENTEAEKNHDVSKIEIEHLVDLEKNKQLEYIERERELQLLEQIRQFKESLYPYTNEITEYYRNLEISPQLTINLFA